MGIRLVASLALCCWAAGWLFEPPPPSRFVQSEVRIPAAGGRTTLAVTILRPRGDGRFGAVILNHGTAPTRAGRHQESPALLIHAAVAFASRGYAVLMPLRRGFGATGGRFAEDSGSCSDPDFRRGEAAAAQDILATYAFARRLPYVDASRMILAGQSAGGVASLYAAARRPEGLAAVVAFAAGRGGDPVASPGLPCAAARLATVFEEMGRSVKAPVLLYYAENDRFFGPETSRAWFRSFKAGGARAQYVLQEPFGPDGHYVFSDAEQWLPAVERFLAEHRIPFQAPQPRI
jgi:dienelactone hydrolase